MTARATAAQQEWVIWNGLLGAVDTVLIGKIQPKRLCLSHAGA
jgi:hypothetical protein